MGFRVTCDPFSAWMFPMFDSCDACITSCTNGSGCMDFSNEILYQNGNNRCMTGAKMGEPNASMFVMCSADNSTWSATAHGTDDDGTPYTPGGHNCTAAPKMSIPTTASGTCYIMDERDSGSTLQVSMTLLILSFVSVVALGL